MRALPSAAPDEIPTPWPALASLELFLFEFLDRLLGGFFLSEESALVLVYTLLLFSSDSKKLYFLLI
jgi:hypothetical protein